MTRWITQRWVYFAHATKTNRIKIGVSVSPFARAKQLSAEEHEKVTLLGVVLGDRRLERDLHLRFGDIALGREWFTHDARIIDEMSALGADLTCAQGGQHRRCHAPHLLPGVAMMAQAQRPSIGRIVHYYYGWVLERGSQERTNPEQRRDGPFAAIITDIIDDNGLVEASPCPGESS